MRVVAGSARGRRLVAPAGRSTTRPTPDRVREATFNALVSRGALDGATVLDLFAGSGALGIEALSRGAAHATFVDADAAALAAVRANLAACGFAGRAEVVRGEATAFLAGAGDRRWDLALLDPPYAFDGWAELLAALPAAEAVVESDREVGLPAGWRAERAKRYGGTVVVIAARTVGDGAPEPGRGVG
ncbi:MAG: 16S rRNA (guanine(966)-N(2))-methyltransferase RsmD [Acidimicrobiia bacterium]